MSYATYAAIGTRPARAQQQSHQRKGSHAQLPSRMRTASGIAPLENTASAAAAAAADSSSYDHREQPQQASYMIPSFEAAPHAAPLPPPSLGAPPPNAPYQFGLSAASSSPSTTFRPMRLPPPHPHPPAHTHAHAHPPNPISHTRQYSDSHLPLHMDLFAAPHAHQQIRPSHAAHHPQAQALPSTLPPFSAGQPITMIPEVEQQFRNAGLGGEIEEGDEDDDDNDDDDKYSANEGGKGEADAQVQGAMQERADNAAEGRQRSSSFASFGQKALHHDVPGGSLLLASKKVATGSIYPDGEHDRPQKRRRRANMSCTQCKSRKIKCDRARPICGSCVRRGIPPQTCLLGDARDDYERMMSAPDVLRVVRLMERIASLEEELDQSNREKEERQAAYEHVLASRSAADTLAEENLSVSVSNNSRSCAPSSMDAMEQRLRIDAEVARSHYQDRERMHSASNGLTMSAATNFVLNFNPVGLSPLEDMLATLPSESNIITIVNWYYDELEPVWSLLPSRPSMCTRIEDLWRRYQTFIKSQSSAQKPATNAETTADAGKPNAAGGASPSAAAAGSGVASPRSSISGYVSAVAPHGTSAPKPGAAGGSTQISPALAQDAHPSDRSRGSGQQPQQEQAQAHQQHLRQRSSASSLPNIGQAFSKSDYAFLALVFAVLESSAEFMADADIIEHGIATSTKDIPVRMSMYHRNCVTLLSMSDMLAQPTLEGIQAISMLRYYYFGRQRRAEYTVLHTMIIRIAEGLGLHRLQSAHADAERWAKRRLHTGSPFSPPASSQAGWHNNAKHAPPKTADGGSGGSAGHAAAAGTGEEAHATDSERGSHALIVGTMNRTDLHGWFLPKGEHKEKWEEMNVSRWYDGDHEMRELGRRVWWALVFVDWQTATLHDGIYHAREATFTTGFPLNAELADISRTSDPLAIASPEKSFVAILTEIARATRCTADAMNSGVNEYEDSLQIEQSHRSILTSLPYYYQFPSEHNAATYDAAAVQAAHTEKPFRVIQRVLIYLYVHHRLLKLHRLYMPRGYRNGVYKHSREVCLESAEVLLSCYSELVQASSPIHRMWSFRMMLFDAISTLQIDLLHRIAQVEDQEIIRRQADVELGIRLLEPHTSMEKLNKFLPAAISAMRALQHEEKCKRAAFRHEQQRAHAQGQAPPTQKWTLQVPFGALGAEDDVPAAFLGGALASDSLADQQSQSQAPPPPPDKGAGQRPVGADPSADALEASRQFQMELDEWLRSIRESVASEQGNLGAAKLIDKLIEEMNWSW
ncbi:hypothetical protein K437DRAFT_115767 [Tilletiaria anomala UBC 951]|uniref:Zn(2)-C6 fungal-type domain-containing protein n=1 Tax=Tilletiaria anomala (strain ATCC 24038 / CBS 436.72 / UBC 951) TaxID=1037660 RepID=A0A066WGZ4_TILAU|nr:uncharacterized protein K437DRAFT_115767 [Tilletiaria anomala UBC 951]KDN53086.1 hypothetical protein K437DRAFT_115767 [Tilletiaria anomala UBC 951]